VVVLWLGYVSASGEWINKSTSPVYSQTLYIMTQGWLALCHDIQCLAILYTGLALCIDSAILISTCTSWPRCGYNLTAVQPVTGQFPYCLVISPTGHFAYWSFRLRDISPTTWTARLQIALHFTNKTTRIK